MMDTDYTMQTKLSDLISCKIREGKVSTKDHIRKTIQNWMQCEKKLKFLNQALLPSLFSPLVHPHLGTLVWGKESDILQIH